MEPSAREHWGSKLGFVLAATGSALGLGNIWKFPYLAGANGGAAFVLVYLACILILGLPIMIAELVIGRHTGKNPVGAFRSIGGGKWTGVGYMGVLTGFLIMTFYSVVGGWTLGYMVKSVTGAIASITDIQSSGKLFTSFSSNAWEGIAYQVLFMAATMFVVIRGISKGIERYTKVLMPLLFVILVILIVRGLTLPGAGEGLQFYLNPDFSKITPKVVIEALGQCFFSLSLGMGAMITYGSYLTKNEKILTSTLQIVGLDTLAAFLAGLAIFPAVFAFGMTPELGPGLTFNILPVVFSRMAYGSFFAFLFFTLLFIAALSSAISLVEVVVAYGTDERGWSRKKAVLIFGTTICVLGIPAALSFGLMGDIKIFFGLNYFDFMDRLTSVYMLPIGGLLIAICLGWKYGLDRTSHELDGDTRIGLIRRTWALGIRYVAPIILLVIILYFGVYRVFAG
ncbi:MAG: sodium-dependent transporter [Spirochaetes bacterium]|nr:sodium-dependent transporter [Spirochaetota bacterium]